MPFKDLWKKIFGTSQSSKTPTVPKVVKSTEEVPEYLKQYHELLKDPKWLRRKKQVIKDHGCRCAMCKKSKPLQVHHLYYLEDTEGNKLKPWIYPADALIPLCFDCHKKIHLQGKPKVHIISSFIVRQLTQLYDY